MPELMPCPGCEQHIFASACRCAHCGVTLRECRRKGATSAAVMLGFALSGCVNHNANVDYGTGLWDTADTAAASSDDADEADAKSEDEDEE